MSERKNAPVDIAQLRGLLVHADVTELPWKSELTVATAEHWVVSVERGFFGAVAQPATGPDDYGRANAELIAAGISALPALLDELEALRAAVGTSSAPAATDVVENVMTLTDDEAIDAAVSLLSDLDLTYDELAAQAAAHDYTSLRARLAWMSVSAVVGSPNSAGHEDRVAEIRRSGGAPAPDREPLVDHSGSAFFKSSMRHVHAHRSALTAEREDSA